MPISYLQQVLETSLAHLSQIPAAADAHTLASELLAELNRLDHKGDIHADRRRAKAEWEKASAEATRASRRLRELRTPELLNVEARCGRAHLRLSQANDTLQRIKAIERRKRPQRADLIAQAKRLCIEGCSKMRVDDLVDAIGAAAEPSLAVEA